MPLPTRMCTGDHVLSGKHEGSHPLFGRLKEKIGKTGKDAENQEICRYIPPEADIRKTSPTGDMPGVLWIA